MPKSEDSAEKILRLIESLKPEFDRRYSGMDYSDGIIHALEWITGKRDIGELINIEELA